MYLVRYVSLRSGTFHEVEVKASVVRIIGDNPITQLLSIEKLKEGKKMQKNYRDYTVGELLDMGFKVGVVTHDVDYENEAKEVINRFEGVKQSTNELSFNQRKVVRGWKGKFEVSCFTQKKEGAK